MRVNFDLIEDENFTIEIGQELFVFRRLNKFAQIGIRDANVWDHVLITDDGRFLRVTIVGEDERLSSIGVRKGWYVADWIERADAQKLRKSWEILGGQPYTPQGNLL